jgi:cytochrome c556
MKSLGKVALLGVIFLGLASQALGQRPEPPSPEEQAVSYRQSIFKMLNWKMGRLAEASQASDAEAFRGHASDMVYLAGLITEGFIPNSRLGNSKAKEDIWKDWDKFVETAAGFQDKARALAAPEYDISSFDPRDFGSNACGSCHRPFRERD